MKRVQREEILDYVTYEERREEIRSRILVEKRRRRVHLGGILTFLFENADTVRYQVQEMMRVERIVREPDILHELESCNELLGGEGELGCTLLIEIEDEEERREKLASWLKLPEHVYVTLEDGERVYACFDARQVGDDRLSSVQYLKFPTGGRLPTSLGCDLLALDLPEEEREVVLTDEQRVALGEDLGR